MQEQAPSQVHMFELWEPPKIPQNVFNQFFKSGEGWIHRSSFVDEGATIMKGAVIWHFCHVASTAVIGKDCMIGQGCFIAGAVGRRSRIQNGVSVWKEVVIGPECFIGPGVQFTNAHRPHPPYKTLPVPTTICAKTAICASATIIAPCSIADNSFVAAGAVVRSDIYPPHSALIGCPAVHNKNLAETNAVMRGRTRKAHR